MYALARVLEAGGKLMRLPPQIPLLGRIVAQYGEGQVMIGADAHGACEKVVF